MTDPTPSARRAVLREEIEFEERLSAADTLMWNVEADPVLRSTITGILLLDGAPDQARFVRSIARAVRRIPRLRQRVVADALGAAPPRWEADPHFDPAFHVRRASLPAPGSERQLLDFARPIAMQAFDKDRPLWELYWVDGLEGGRSAILMKLHHAVSDGVGLVKMTECLVERGPEPDPRREARPIQPLPEASDAGGWERLRDALAHNARGQRDGALQAVSTVSRTALRIAREPFAALRGALETASSVGRLLAPASEPASPIMRERSLNVRFDSLCLPLSELKRAGKAVEGTVNDAFVAGVAGGLRRYHEALGAPVDELRMMMPVNTRNGEKARRAGNQFAPTRLMVPVSTADPARRMRQVHERVRAQRDEPALPWIEEVAGALGRLPTGAAIALFGSMQRATDFITSNVPGPPFDTWVSGARVERVLPFGPLSGASINVTAFSQAGSVHVGISSDPAAVADPGLLVECLQKGFEEVLTVV